MKLRTNLVPTIGLALALALPGVAAASPDVSSPTIAEFCEQARETTISLETYLGKLVSFGVALCDRADRAEAWIAVVEAAIDREQEALEEVQTEIAAIEESLAILEQLYLEFEDEEVLDLIVKTGFVLDDYQVKEAAILAEIARWNGNLESSTAYLGAIRGRLQQLMQRITDLRVVGLEIAPP